MGDVRVLSDASVRSEGDLLNFRRYVNPLVSILTDPEAKTPFTIGIFGAWGGGKSSLLRMLDERLETQHRDEFVRVKFNPWVYRQEENMLIPLLHTLNDALKQDKQERFKDAALRVGKALFVLGADVLLRKLTADVLSLDKLQEAKEALDKERGEIESEIRNLHNTLTTVVNAIHKNGARLVLFIDDLDRCDPAVIIDLLEAIKLFFDLEHTFIILAIDKEVIDRGIQVKYSEFTFAKERESAIGGEYLEKMVQLPLTLFPLYKSQVRTFMEDLQPAPAIAAFLDLLQTVALPNPRKIKRIVNILTLTDAILQGSPALAGLQRELVVRLVVLQVQSGELYAKVARVPDILVALERAYLHSGEPARIRVDRSEDFTQFGATKEYIQLVVQAYYQPESYLADLFKGSTFQQHQAQLPTYLSLLGG